MSTIIIITDPKQPKQQDAVDPVEQILSDAKVLEAAGFKVQVFDTRK